MSMGRKMISRALQGLAPRTLLRTLVYQTFRRKTSVELSGVSASFSTRSPDLYRRAVNVGGERAQLEMFLQQVREEDVVWDVGSFMGMFSMFAAKMVGEKGKVYAFEPESGAHELLTENIRINALKNVFPMDVALSDYQMEHGQLYAPSAEANAIHSLKPSSTLSGAVQNIRIAKGDDLVRSGTIKAPTVVKMDVEGAELQALTGMRDTLAHQNCRFLFLELHPSDLPRFNGTEDDVLALLKKSGFSVEHEIERGTEVHLFLAKHS